MQVSAWESYSPTLLHWLATGAGIILLMLMLNRFLQVMGVKREAATGYALILPWILGFLIWSAYPFARSLYLSFTTYNIFQPPEWVGIENYVTMFTKSRTFWPALKLTLSYAAINVPLGLVGAMGVALLLNRDVKGIGIWRTIYYLPAVLPVAAVALLWRWMFSPSRGLINFMLKPLYELLSVEPLAWFTDPDLTLPAYIIMGMWGVFGANTVILLAGLKNIPQHLYEAADLDGANNWQKFRHITLPMVSSTIFYNMVTGIIASLQIFTQAFFIPRARQNQTFLNVLIYEEAFSRRHMGYASAMAWFLLLVILLITMLVFRSSTTWVYYESERR
jgi:multiple sugar transport system permease protein